MSGVLKLLPGHRPCRPCHFVGAQGQEHRTGSTKTLAPRQVPQEWIAQVPGQDRQGVRQVPRGNDRAPETLRRHPGKYQTYGTIAGATGSLIPIRSGFALPMNNPNASAAPIPLRSCDVSGLGPIPAFWKTHGRFAGRADLVRSLFNRDAHSSAQACKGSNSAKSSLPVALSA